MIGHWSLEEVGLLDNIGFKNLIGFGKQLRSMLKSSDENIEH